MPKNPMPAAMLTLAMLAPTAALADLWNDTPMSDADMYFNQVIVDEDLDIGEFAFARLNCEEGDGSAESASCSMLIGPVGFISLHGHSIDEPPKSVHFVLAKTDEVSAIVQTLATLTAGTSPEASRKVRGRIIQVFSSVVELRNSEDVYIGDTEYTVAFTSGIGITIRMKPSIE